MESSKKNTNHGAYVSLKVFNKLKIIYLMYSEWLQWISKFMSPHKQEQFFSDKL